MTIGDADAEIDPVGSGAAGGGSEIETDRLSAFIEEFNDLFGGIEWGDPDRVIRTATVDIPSSVAKDPRFENARKNSDRENAPVEADKATEQAVLGTLRGCFSAPSATVPNGSDTFWNVLTPPDTLAHFPGVDGLAGGAPAFHAWIRRRSARTTPERRRARRLRRVSRRSVAGRDTLPATAEMTSIP